MPCSCLVVHAPPKTSTGLCCTDVARGAPAPVAVLLEPGVVDRQDGGAAAAEAETVRIGRTGVPVAVAEADLPNMGRHTGEDAV